MGQRDINVVDWIAHHAYATPDALAQVDLATGRRYTYAQMNDRVGRVAQMLLDLGVAPGDRVGFLALNSTDILDIVFGSWRVGAISLALNFRLSAPELEYIVTDAAPHIVFYDDAFGAVVDELREMVEVPHWIGGVGEPQAGAFDKRLSAMSEPVLARTCRQTLSDQCMLMYSSGTTGRPKGVIITHEMMVFSAVNVMSTSRLDQTSVNLAMMPLFHIGGFNIVACPVLYAGGTTIIQRMFDPTESLRVMSDPELGVTHFLAVPAMYNAMKECPAVGTADLSRIKHAFAGAESVPHALVEWWQANGLVVQEGYGMTETAGPAIVISREEAPGNVGSAGKPLIHVEMRLVGENGKDVAVGELGEIWMRGPSITPGYWNRPDANNDSFVDGWFRSGDIARTDEKGFVYIEDRLKDMYISGGENVYPAEVENILFGLEQVIEIAVIGVPDDRWGEVGCAVAVVREGADLTLDDLQSHCSGKLAKFKQPVYLFCVDALPRNATGKVLKYELRGKYSPAIK